MSDGVEIALSRKERERLARQQEIVKAARDLFSKKGYHDTTLEEIAHHAEYGKGTIYNYFASKQELYFAIVNSLLDEAEEVARTALDVQGGARERMRAYARTMMSYSVANSDFFHFLMAEIIKTEKDDARSAFLKLTDRAKGLWTPIAQALEEDIHAGKIRPLDAYQVAAVFDTMLRFFGMHLAGTQGLFSTITLDEAADLVISIFFDGIAERTDRNN